MAPTQRISDSVVIRSSRLRDEDKDLLIAIFKVMPARPINFARVGAEMHCSLRVARERNFRLMHKINSHERPKFHDIEFSFMVRILHDVPDAAIDFDEVAKGTMFNRKVLTGSETKEKYQKMRKRIYRKIKGTGWDEVSLWFIDPYDSEKEHLPLGWTVGTEPVLDSEDVWKCPVYVSQ